MKIKKTTKKANKPILIIVIVLLVGLACFFTYAFALKPQNKTADTSKTDNQSSDKQQSQNLQNNPTDKEKAPNSDAPAAPTPVTGSDKKQVSMVASVDQSNGTVYIRGGVNYPVTDGSCYALLTGPSGQSIRKDSEILPNPASSDCKTIPIAASDLAPGTWTFTLNYTSDTYQGVSSEVSFTL